jgi:hypothetical protein
MDWLLPYSLKLKPEVMIEVGVMQTCSYWKLCSGTNNCVAVQPEFGYGACPAGHALYPLLPYVFLFFFGQYFLYKFLFFFGQSYVFHF